MTTQNPKSAETRRATVLAARTEEFIDTLQDFRDEGVALRKKKAGTKNAVEGVNAEPLVSWALRFVGYLHETIGVSEGDALVPRFWTRTHPQPTKVIQVIDELIADVDNLYLRPTPKV